MSIKNISIKSDYTIDIAGDIVDEYETLAYSSDFSSSTVDQLPAGWTSQNSDSGTGGGAEVKNEITGNASTNKALLIRGERILHESVDNPPVAADGWRWAALTQTFPHPVVVRFKAYQGRNSGGLYSATEHPDAGEHLWLQYKIGSGNWQIAGEPLEKNSDPSGGSWDLDAFVARGINSGASASNPISLRWIYKTNANSDQDDRDLWAIDDIEVYHAGAMPVPKRLTFIGAPNLRLQQTTQQNPDSAYKTFLGKHKV